MIMVRHAIVAALTACIFPAVPDKSFFAQERSSEEETPQNRIVTVEEIKEAAGPGLIKPLSIISYPHRFISSGMEKGLIAFEQHKIRERFQSFTEMLRSRGVEGKFGRIVVCRLWIQTKQRTGDRAQPVGLILGRDQGSNSIKLLGWQHAVHNN